MSTIISIVCIIYYFVFCFLSSFKVIILEYLIVFFCPCVCLIVSCSACLAEPHCSLRGLSGNKTIVYNDFLCHKRGSKYFMSSINRAIVLRHFVLKTRKFQMLIEINFKGCHAGFCLGNGRKTKTKRYTGH